MKRAPWASKALPGRKDEDGGASGAGEAAKAGAAAKGPDPYAEEEEAELLVLAGVVGVPAGGRRLGTLFGVAYE